jgi:hypothetical protein
MRCDIIDTPSGTLSIYRRQSRLHIEFASGARIQKIQKLLHQGDPLKCVLRPCWTRPAAPGTLGIFSTDGRCPDRVVFNDIWKDACEMTRLNLQVNGFSREGFRVCN